MAPLACGGAFAPLRAGPARCAGLWCVARGVKPETCTTLREAAERQGGIPRVILKRGKARLFHLGSHLVFSGAIDRVEGVRMPTHGDTVLLYDGSKMLLGWGLFNPDSMYRVRIMQRCQDAEQQPQCALDLWQLLQTRIEEAVTLRRALGFPSEETNAYRLINSDGDHLSGLVVDVLGDLLVAAPGAAWLQINRQTVVNLLMECTGIRNVIWRPTAGSMEQEGLHDVDAEIFSEGRELASEQVEIREGSIPFLASPFGQKTGFYMDQRDSRAVIRRLAKGQEVLDVYCYSGGFAINAALGGARGVVGVDSSAPAIELAEKNATLSGVSDACSFTQADATQYLELAKQEGRLWDLVVLDPPKLAPNRQSLQRAIPHYRRINRAAIRVLRRGGLLMTCTCSGAMTQSNKFLDVVKQAADAEGRRVTVLRVAGASADHSCGFQVGQPAYDLVHFGSIGAANNLCMCGINGRMLCTSDGGLSTNCSTLFGSVCEDRDVLLAIYPAVRSQPSKRQSLPCQDCSFTARKTGPKSAAKDRWQVEAGAGVVLRMCLRSMVAVSDIT